MTHQEDFIYSFLGTEQESGYTEAAPPHGAGCRACALWGLLIPTPSQTPEDAGVAMLCVAVWKRFGR